MCPCSKGDKPAGHLIYNCDLLQQQRGRHDTRISTWNLSNKQTRTNKKILKSFVIFTKSIVKNKL